MRSTDRFVNFVTERSALVVVVMLLLSVGMGAGMAFLDDEAGLEQFQFESEESEALDYIEENFEVEDDQTTTVQIVLRSEEDVLTRESFIATLELQSDIRTDEEINRTLAMQDPFADLASIVATTAIQQEEGEDIEAEGDELEAESEELETESERLEADQEELEETADILSDGLNETREFEEEFIALNASFEGGEIDQQTYQEESTQLSDELDSIGTETASLLDDESHAAYESLRDDVRQLTGEVAEVEQRYESGELTEAERDEQVDQLESEVADVYGDIQEVVLAEEFATLAERGEELEEWGEELEESSEELEGESAEIQQLDPTLAEQIEKLEEMDDEEFDEVLGTVLGEDAPRGVLVFLPVDFDTSSTETDARQLFITQTTDGEIVDGEAPPDIENSQLAIAELVDDRFGDDAFVFGAGIISDEIDRSMADSMAIVLPLALLFVVIVLSIAYRDPLDIILGVFGIVLVLVWTFGFMGWTGIAFNQIMIAVPVLLVGLSIDYAIHVFMRHREQRADGQDGTRPSMAIVLLGLGAALVWVTITAVIGFLSNLVSPVAPIQEFGLVSAFGIAATLLIFGTFVPAAKVGFDSVFEARGWDRRKRAFGTGGGMFTSVLSGGHRLARRMPVVVVVVVLLLTAGGAYGAAQVDTTFEQEDFIADEPAEWMNSLPAAFAPGEYSVKSNMEFVNERFLRQDTNTQVLIEGDITADETLTDIDRANDIATEQDVIVTLSDGEADIRSALSVMEDVASENETFADTFEQADTTGDDVPDENITAVYDAFFDAAPDRASDVIYRSDGEYEATRMVLSIQGGATATEATDATRDVSSSLDRADRPTIATGQLVVFKIIEDELFNTVLESLLITLVAVFAFLMVAYRFAHGSALLGAVTLTPIVLTVAWILGTMYLLGIPFNVMTGTITSLTIGLGVAYNIHMTERYQLELVRGQNVWSALYRAVTGTGGALLGSAATTAGGFGVLALAILPPLQQFGIITGLTIIYAFLGSVFVLPSFLVLWTRYLGPSEKFPSDERTPQSGGDTPPSAPAGTGRQPVTTATAGPGSVVTEFDPPSTGSSAVSPARSQETQNRESGHLGTQAGIGQQEQAAGQPTRTVAPSVLEPGLSYTTTISIPLTPGQTVLYEDPSVPVESVEIHGPDPVEMNRTASTVSVQWNVDNPTVARIVYTGSVPQTDSDQATFGGRVVTNGSKQAITGDVTATLAGNGR